MDYDEILNELGQFSKWHWLQYSIILLFPVTGAFATLSFSFTGMILLFVALSRIEKYIMIDKIELM